MGTESGAYYGSVLGVKIAPRSFADLYKYALASQKSIGKSDFVEEPWLRERTRTPEHRQLIQISFQNPG